MVKLPLSPIALLLTWLLILVPATVITYLMAKAGEVTLSQLLGAVVSVGVLIAACEVYEAKHTGKEQNSDA